MARNIKAKYQSRDLFMSAFIVHESKSSVQIEKPNFLSLVWRSTLFFERNHFSQAFNFWSLLRTYRKLFQCTWVGLLARVTEIFLFLFCLSWFFRSREYYRIAEVLRIFLFKAFREEFQRWKCSIRDLFVTNAVNILISHETNNFSAYFKSKQVLIRIRQTEPEKSPTEMSEPEYFSIRNQQVFR